MKYVMNETSNTKEIKELNNEEINEVILYEMIYLLNPVNVNDKTIYTFIDRIPQQIKKEPIKTYDIKTYDIEVLQIYEKLKSEYLIKPNAEIIVDSSHHGYKNPIEFYTICGRIMDFILDEYNLDNENELIKPDEISPSLEKESGITPEQHHNEE